MKSEKKISKGLKRDLESLRLSDLEFRIDKYISVMGIANCNWQDDEDPEVFWREDCPICLSSDEDRLGVFCVDMEWNTFRCTQCHTKGGSFTLLSLILKLSPKETIEYVQKMFL